MSDENVKLTMILEFNPLNDAAKLNKILEETLNACKKFGAYEVRKAAIRQMRSDNKALKEVGLDYSIDNDVFTISDKAFSLLTDEEKLKDYNCHFANYNFKYSE